MDAALMLSAPAICCNKSGWNKIAKNQGSRDVERLFQGGGKAHRLSGVVVIEHKSGDGEDDEGNQHRRHRGVHHVADMGEKRRVRGRRGEHRRVGKGRNLVAEVCPRNNSSRCPSG